MNFKDTEMLKGILSVLGFSGFIFSIFFMGLFWGIAIGWDGIYGEMKVTVFSNNNFQNLAMSCLLISFFLLTFTVFLQVKRQILSKSICLISLILLILQCRILNSYMPSKLNGWMKGYSDYLQIILYVDYLFSFIAIAMGVLFLVYIFLEHKSKSQINNMRF